MPILEVVKNAPQAAEAPSAPKTTPAAPTNEARLLDGGEWLCGKMLDDAMLVKVQRAERNDEATHKAAAAAAQAVAASTSVREALSAAASTEAAAVRSMGALLGAALGYDPDRVTVTLEATVGAKKTDSGERELALLAVALLCGHGGSGVEFWAVSKAVPLLLAGFEDAAESVRMAAKLAAQQVGRGVHPQALRLCMSTVYPAIDSTSKWKAKVAGLQLLGAIASAKPEGLEFELPDIIPLVIDCLGDTKVAVQDAATVCLAESCGLIRTPETVKLMPLFLAAITEPDKMTNAALEKLMDITFCNALGADSLAVLVPVMLRGLRTGEAELTKCACKAACNMLSLVASAEVMTPFVDRMMPEFQKTEHHSYPEIRELGVKSMEELRNGIAGAESIAEQRDRAKKGRAEVESVLGAFGGRGDFPAEALAHLATVAAGQCVGTLATCPGVMSVADLSHTAQRVLLGLADREAADALCEHLAANYPATHHRKHAWEEDGGGGEYIVDLPNIICGFAGRVLLRRAHFRLEKGHVYGLVGQNGVGKTTLLTRIVQRDIYGFPSDLGCHLVACHDLEAYQELPYTVTEFMQNVCKTTGCDESLIAKALSNAGFDERPDLYEQKVSQLSGGWRMKLGIAKSELFSRDLLLLVRALAAA